jgi:hypothetical protein
MGGLCFFQGGVYPPIARQVKKMPMPRRAMAGRAGISEGIEDADGSSISNAIVSPAPPSAFSSRPFAIRQQRNKTDQNGSKQKHRWWCSVRREFFGI